VQRLEITCGAHPRKGGTIWPSCSISSPAKIVGWAMRDHMRAELTIAALTMAIKRQKPPRRDDLVVPHDVRHRNPFRQQVVGDDAAVAAPPHSFSTHNGAAIVTRERS
jgi:hypothetical protein